MKICNKINICFLADDNYIMQTTVTVNSILRNMDKDTYCDIFIISNNCSDSNLKRVKLLENSRLKINVILVDKFDDFLKFNIEGISASPTAICKFYLPEILNDLDKVLYLDGDIIVKSDLSSLYNIDLCDNYVAAVKDTCGLSKSLYNLFKKNVFYFNSGVMLMNLRKMREDNISEKLMDYRINGFNQLMDQDALNYVLRNHVIVLPFKFNTQLSCFDDVKRFNQDSKIEVLKEYFDLDYNISSFDDLITDSIILHYSGSIKPWNVSNVLEGDLWVYYYYDSPFKDIVLRKRIKNKKKISFLKKVVKKYRKYNFMKNFKK